MWSAHKSLICWPAAGVCNRAVGFHHQLSYSWHLVFSLKSLEIGYCHPHMSWVCLILGLTLCLGSEMWYFIALIIPNLSVFLGPFNFFLSKTLGLYVQETCMQFSRHISGHLIGLTLLGIDWFYSFEKQSATWWLLIVCPGTMLNSCSNYQQGGSGFQPIEVAINTDSFVSSFLITMPLCLFYLFLDWPS